MRTVLIVEDTAHSAATLEIAFLAIPGLDVKVASAGQEALDALECEDPKVCALVTDLNMPRMDGFELIRRIRALERHERLPIIVISGDTDPATPERIYQLGADAYFSKPYSPALVRQKLEQLLGEVKLDARP